MFKLNLHVFKLLQLNNLTYTLYSSLLLSQIKIRVGEYDFASVQEPHGYVERGVKKKVVHPRYNFFTYENDLALVQLEDAIDSIKYPHISPICLPPSEENLVGKNATVTGWGRLSEGRTTTYNDQIIITVFFKMHLV